MSGTGCGTPLVYSAVHRRGSVLPPFQPIRRRACAAVAGGPRMLAAVRSATLLGVEGHPVTVEVHVSRACRASPIVGLPDEACRESRDRVRAAVLSSGLAWPAKRITVNLAPANQRKGGSGLDLAIAVGVLVADEQIPAAAVDGPRRSSASSGSTGRCAPSPGVAPMVAALDGSSGRRAARLVPRGARRRPRTVRVGRHAWPRWSLRCTARRRGPTRPTTPSTTTRRRPGPGRRPRPGRRPARRWRSPPPVGTTCCSSARRARARRCSPSACPACCRR